MFVHDFNNCTRVREKGVVLFNIDLYMSFANGPMEGQEDMTTHARASQMPGLQQLTLQMPYMQTFPHGPVTSVGALSCFAYPQTQVT